MIDMENVKELEFEIIKAELPRNHGDPTVELKIKNLPIGWHFGNLKLVYEDPLYKIGDRFIDIDTNEEFIMAKINGCGKRLCALISLVNGNYFSEFSVVKNPYAITNEEFYIITNGNHFKKIT